MSIRSSYDLTKLFLALSDVTRQQLLNQLDEPTSVIDICATFDILVHEAVRHLRRLEDVTLISHLSNGEYVISQYGRALVPLVEGISNVHDLLEYWERHTMSELPAHLRCLPSQLNDQFLSNAALHEAIEGALDESREFLWVLNYPVGRSSDRVSDFRTLISERGAAHSHTRVIEDVYSSLLINEHRAFIFFPGVTDNDEYCSDRTNGFMIREANPTYRLVAEFFRFLWEKKARQERL
ncbi:MAG: hypothetical protein ACXVIF_05785 [Halobacteriota archaeon]